MKLSHVSHARRGITSLLDTLVVIWMMSIMLMMGVALLGGMLQLQRASMTSFDRLLTQGSLADQFRADIHQASATPEKWGQFTAGPHCLILRRPDGIYVVYRWENSQLERQETAGELKSHQRIAVGLDASALTFTRGNRLITLRLTETPSQHGPPHEWGIAAALGGDLK